MHFGFKVLNPTVTVQISIPLIVYSLRTNQMSKTNYNLVENVIYVRALNNPVLVSNTALMDVGSGQMMMQVRNTHIEFVPRTP